VRPLSEAPEVIFDDTKEITRPLANKTVPLRHEYQRDDMSINSPKESHDDSPYGSSVRMLSGQKVQSFGPLVNNRAIQLLMGRGNAFIR